MNLNFVFSNSMNLNLIFSKSVNLNLNLNFKIEKKKMNGFNPSCNYCYESSQVSQVSFYFVAVNNAENIRKIAQNQLITYDRRP